MKPHAARFVFRIFLMACTVAVVVAAVPAFAYEGPVPNDCTVGGTQLQGLAEVDARAAIAAASAVPSLPALTFAAAGRTFTFSPTSALALDVETMLAQAYETTTAVGFEISPTYVLNATTVSSWAVSIARSVDRAPVNAKYYVRSSRVAVAKSVAGRRLDRTATAATVRSAVASALAGSEMSTAPAALRVVVLRPSITGANLGKAILVDISERRIRVYSVARIIRTYRCAVGMRAYPTPVGSFRVIRKVKNPSWHNPGSDWSGDMPSVIGPGPSNPLGTRALYLSSPGIRIHGTSKRYSIGTAASHGCMRMLRENIEALYEIIPVGTPVFIVR